MNSRWTLKFGVAAVGLVGVLAFIFSCVSRRGLEPVPTSYTLYASAWRFSGEFEYSLITFDAETYELKDTLIHSSEAIGSISVGSDERYLALWGGGRGTEIWDVSPFALHASFPTRTLDAVILYDTNLIVAPAFESTLVYSVPELTQHASWPLELLSAVALPHKSAVIGIATYGDHSSPGPDRLLVFDYVTGQVVDSAFTAVDNLPAFSFRTISASPDGERVYGLGGGGTGGPRVFGYDLMSHRLLFETPLWTVVGDVRVNPGGDEVWVTDPGHPNPVYPEGPGVILAIDAFTGEVLDTIRTEGYDPDGEGPIYVREIRFHPDGKTAFVSGGSLLRGGGPILVIDTGSREITRLLFETFLDVPASIQIAPSPS